MEIFWNIFESSSNCQRRSWPRIYVYMYIYIIFGLSSELRVFRGGLRKERRIGNATQPDSVFIDVQQFYLAIDISNLAFLSSTCSVYFMRPQIRRPAALEVSRKGEKYESDGVKRLPKTNFPINLERFNKLIIFHHLPFFFTAIYRIRRGTISPTSILQHREF